jgi:hypothetical protein
MPRCGMTTSWATRSTRWSTMKNSASRTVGASRKQHTPPETPRTPERFSVPSITETPLEELVSAVINGARRPNRYFESRPFGVSGLRLDLRETVCGDLLQTRHKFVVAEYDPEEELRVFAGSSRTTLDSIQPSLREFFLGLGSIGLSKASVASRSIEMTGISTAGPPIDYIHNLANCVYLRRERRDDDARLTPTKVGYFQV